MRGYKFFIAITIYVALISLVAGCFLIFQSKYSPETGKILFWSIFATQIFMLIIYTPSLTCTSISSERENGTIELLLTTQISPVQIITGKMLFPMANVSILILTSLPVASISFFFGGVSPLEIAIAYISLIISGFLFLFMGLYFSIHYSSKTAQWLTYGFIFGINIGGVFCLALLLLIVISLILLITRKNKKLKNSLLKQT